MSDELKACPFCGSPGEYKESTRYDHVSASDAQQSGLGYSAGTITHTTHGVYCSDTWNCCGSQCGYSKERAIAAWNRRKEVGSEH